MKIINELLPSINTYNPRDPKITWSKNFTAGANDVSAESSFDFDAWYCLFSCEHSFEIYKIKDLVDSETFQRFLDKTLFLVLDNSLEPFEKGIDSIYKNIVIGEGIPASQVILLTNMYDAKSYSDRLSNKLNQTPIKILWYTVFEKDLNKAVQHVYKCNTPNTLKLKEYPKKFLNLNRRWRLHRPFLITLMHSRNLLDKGYISFGPCDERDTWKHRWPELLHYFKKDLKMTVLLNQNHNVRTLPPLFLDTTELHINRAESTVDTNKYYENSYFSVISETTYFTKEWYYAARFLSEKAFKTIAMKHPFILVSVPNSLEIYKIMGYKTFAPLIDESYDLEHDDGKRMIMLLNEIERLCNLTQPELEKFLVEAKKICEYNYNVLMSKNKFITEL